MNVDNIIEALHCCSAIEPLRDCESCPYFEESRCLDKLLEHAQFALERAQFELEVKQG